MTTTLNREPPDSSNAGATPPAGQLGTGSAKPMPAEAVLERRLKLVTGIVAPTTVLTALMFYYGYVATAAEYGYFGISMGSLDLSYQDLLLKSVGALYVPLGSVLLLLLFGVWGHAWIRRRLGTAVHTDRWRRAAIVMVVCGTGIFARGVAGVVIADISRSEPIAMTPICLGVGIGAVAYGRFLLRALSPGGSQPKRHWAETAGLVIVIGLVVLSLFWAANSFAGAYGTGRAEQIAELLENRPAVVLDTTERLYALYGGLREAPLPTETDQRFRYRYIGLRLLVESGGRMFLLPEGWDSESGAVLVVPSDANVRLQFYRTRD